MAWWKKEKPGWAGSSGDARPGGWCRPATEPLSTASPPARPRQMLSRAILVPCTHARGGWDRGRGLWQGSHRPCGKPQERAAGCWQPRRQRKRQACAVWQRWQRAPNPVAALKDREASNLLRRRLCSGIAWLRRLLRRRCFSFGLLGHRLLLRLVLLCNTD